MFDTVSETSHLILVLASHKILVLASHKILVLASHKILAAFELSREICGCSNSFHELINKGDTCVRLSPIGSMPTGTIIPHGTW